MRDRASLARSGAGRFAAHHRAAERSPMLIEGLLRNHIADYVQALTWVYGLIVIVYVLLNMMFSFGLRPPYSRWADSVLGFLRDVSDPYLRLFRRFIPPLGMVDLSPMIAIIVLFFVGRILYAAIHT
jgi:YggT family protein